MSSRWLPVVVALPFVVAALLTVVFEVAREIPANYDCGEEAAPGLDEQVDAYRKGYIPLHVAGFLSALAALVTISAVRMRRTGRGGIGWLTGLALGLLIALFVAGAVWEEVRVAFIVVVFPAIGLVMVAQFIGPVATGVLAALLLLAGGLGRGVAPPTSAGCSRSLSCAGCSCCSCLLTC